MSQHTTTGTGPHCPILLNQQDKPREQGQPAPPGEPLNHIPSPFRNLLINFLFWKMPSRLQTLRGFIRSKLINCRKVLGVERAGRDGCREGSAQHWSFQLPGNPSVLGSTGLNMLAVGTESKRDH